MANNRPTGISRQKKIALGSAILLFCILYFSFSLTDKKAKARKDKERSLITEATGPEALLKEARLSASGDTLELVERLQHATEGKDTANILDNLKRISGIWYSQRRYGLAGYYAEKVAELEKTATAWSIAGTSYGMGVKVLSEGSEREFCAGRAAKAFEKAISIEPDATIHRLNLAAIYADAPPKDDVMKGIKMLLDLNKKEPGNTAVINLLGELAIKTGQFYKAIERLEESYRIDPDNPQTPCLLSMAYEGAGQHEKAHELAEKCRN